MSRSLALYIAIRPEVERDIPLRFMFEAGATFFVVFFDFWSRCLELFGLFGSFLGWGYVLVGSGVKGWSRCWPSKVQSFGEGRMGP